jgi:hypothetical protein
MDRLVTCLQKLDSIVFASAPFSACVLAQERRLFIHYRLIRHTTGGHNIRVIIYFCYVLLCARYSTVSSASVRISHRTQPAVSSIRCWTVSTPQRISDRELGVTHSLTWRVLYIWTISLPLYYILIYGLFTDVIQQHRRVGR